MRPGYANLAYPEAGFTESACVHCPFSFLVSRWWQFLFTPEVGARV